MPEGWCVDTDLTINQNTNYTANVYSSYEDFPDGLVDRAENLVTSASPEQPLGDRQYAAGDFGA